MPLWTPDELARVDLAAFKKIAANVWRVRFEVTQPEYCAEKVALVEETRTQEGIDFMLSLFDADGCSLFLTFAAKARLFIPAGLRKALEESAAYATEDVPADTQTVPKDTFLAALTGGDLPQTAVANDRCLLPPIGCGQPARSFADALSRGEYLITGICQSCQDRMAAVALEEEKEDAANHIPTA